MLYRDRLLAALDATGAAFDSYDARRAGRLEQLRGAFDELANLGAAALLTSLAGMEAPGALPTAEWDRGGRVPFGLAWQDHTAARAWARQALVGHPTFAADGSQVEPDKRFSPPAALVQVATFENLHRLEGDLYHKDATVRVLGPEELREDELGPPKRKVDLARFELEVQALIRYVSERGSQEAVAFLDGSLVVSFAEKRAPDRFAEQYVRLVRQLLEASEAHRVPLVAYIDTSYAHDLVSMLAAHRGLDPVQDLSDGVLLEGRLGWGDRTPTAICARPGILEAYGPWARRLGFCYLQTSSDAPPARLEYPLWLVEAGLLDGVLDVVRAEAIAGGGYPYTLAAADAAAVLTSSDREAFWRALQEFLGARDVPLRFSRKALSKLRRR